MLQILSMAHTCGLINATAALCAKRLVTVDTNYVLIINTNYTNLKFSVMVSWDLMCGNKTFINFPGVLYLVHDQELVKIGILQVICSFFYVVFMCNIGC